MDDLDRLAESLRGGRLCRYCERQASGPLGACKDHNELAIDRLFADAVRYGGAKTQPPACFTNKQWREYVVAAALPALERPGRELRAIAPIDFCRDCHKRHRDAMTEAGRCAHPETVFIVEHRTGDAIGVPLKDPTKPRLWEQAIMGVSGNVIGMPPPEQIERAMNAIADATAPKPRGRPKKKGGDDVAPLSDQH